jgi:hypothetical protein
MIARAEIYQLPAQTHGNTHQLHMARDAPCKGPTLEAALQKDQQPIPILLKEPAIRNGCLQRTSPPFNQQCLVTAESRPDTENVWYGMQAASSLEARRQTGVVQSLVRDSPAQILVEDSQLDQPGNISQKRKALDCDFEFLHVVIVCWERGKDEEESFGGQNEVSDPLLLKTTNLTLDRLTD